MTLENIGDNLLANAAFAVLGVGIWFIREKFRSSDCNCYCCKSHFGTSRSSVVEHHRQDSDTVEEV